MLFPIRYFTFIYIDYVFLLVMTMMNVIMRKDMNECYENWKLEFK